MTPARLPAAVALALSLALATGGARADGLCDQLGRAADLAKTGFQPIEGDALPTDSAKYRRSTIQLSDGDNCAVEDHRVLSCAWQPSTADDLKKMVASVAACFPNARTAPVAADDDSPPGTSFKLDAASIDVGLTANVLSLNVGP